MKITICGIILALVYLTLIALTIFVFTPPSYGATRYTLKAYMVSTPFQSLRQKQAALSSAITIIKRNTGVYLRPTIVPTTRSYLAGLYRRDWTCSGDIAYCMYAKTQNLNLFYYGPWLYKGEIWFTGHSQGVCILNRGGSVVEASQKRQNGMSGVRMSSYAIAHELMHLLGMRDNSYPGHCIIDWTGMLTCADTRPSLSLKGKQQVKECTR